MTNVAVQLAVVRDLVEALNAHDYDRAYALFSPTADHLGQPQHAKGRDAMREIDSVFYDAFPDNHRELEQVVADGTNVVAIMRVSGTHTGDVAGPPTGRRVSFLICNVIGFDGEGRIASMNQFFDSAEVTRQLSDGGGPRPDGPGAGGQKKRRRRSRRPKQATGEPTGAPGDAAAHAPAATPAGASGNGEAPAPPAGGPPPAPEAAPPPPPAPESPSPSTPPESPSPPPAEGTPPGAPPAAPAAPAPAE